MKWSEVVEDQRYIDASPERKRFIQEDWYKENIMSHPQYEPSLNTQIRRDIFGEEIKPKVTPKKIKEVALRVTPLTLPFKEVSPGIFETERWAPARKARQFLYGSEEAHIFPKFQYKADEPYFKRTGKLMLESLEDTLDVIAPVAILINLARSGIQGLKDVRKVIQYLRTKAPAEAEYWAKFSPEAIGRMNKEAEAYKALRRADPAKAKELYKFMQERRIMPLAERLARGEPILGKEAKFPVPLEKALAPLKVVPKPMPKPEVTAVVPEILAKPTPLAKPIVSKIELMTIKEPPKIPEATPEAIVPVVDNVPATGIEKPKPEAPLQKEARPEPTVMFQVQLQTAKGPIITHMSEAELTTLEAAVAESVKTKKPAMFKGTQIANITDKFKMNFKDIGSEGFAYVPGADDIRAFHRHLEQVTDPVRSAPPDVARGISQRRIDQNVLIHNINRIKANLQRLVPSPEQRAIVTRFLEVDGEAAVGDQMTTDMRIAAEIIRSGQDKIGMLAKKFKVIRTFLDDYMKHLIKDPNLTIEEVDSKIRWAMSTNKISKYVESKHPRIKTETGEIMFPTVESLKAAGYKVVTEDAIELYDYTMRSEGIAVINAELADRLAKVPYVDPRDPTKKLFQVMTIKPDDRPPRGFRLLRRGVFTMKWASPEVYNAISAIAEPPMGGRLMRGATGLSKRIKFLLPFYHLWNLWRNTVETRGIPMSFKLIYDGAKQLSDPQRVSQVLQMGVNLFRINRMAGAITEEFMGPASKGLGKIIFWLPEKLTIALFCGMGDSVTMGLVQHLEKQLKDTPGLSTKEMHEIIAEISNTLSGNLDPESMSRIVRDVGRVGLLARNWTISNIREGKGALSGRFLPNYWSPVQKRAVRNWYRRALLRFFLHMFTVANIITWLTAKKHYGKGRFTWENKGKWERKIMPFVGVNKNTGKEYFISNFYGSGGDIIHWMTRPITTLEYKLMVPVREVMQQIANRDFFTGERIRRDCDNLVQGIAHRLQHAAWTLGTPAGLQRQVGKYPTPTFYKVLRLMGLSVGSNIRDADMLKKLMDYREKKRYETLEIDRKIYQKISKGDWDGAVDIIAKEIRYKSQKGVMNLYEKMRNPIRILFTQMSREDKAKFLDSLSPKEKERFWEVMEK